MPPKPCSAPDCRSPRHKDWAFCRRHLNARRREMERSYLTPHVKVPWVESLPIDDGPTRVYRRKGEG